MSEPDLRIQGGLEYGSNSSGPKVHPTSGYFREADGTPVICAASEMNVTKNYASKRASRRMADPAVGGEFVCLVRAESPESRNLAGGRAQIRRIRRETAGPPVVRFRSRSGHPGRS